LPRFARSKSSFIALERGEKNLCRYCGGVMNIFYCIPCSAG